MTKEAVARALTDEELARAVSMNVEAARRGVFQRMVVGDLSAMRASLVETLDRAGLLAPEPSPKEKPQP